MEFQATRIERVRPRVWIITLMCLALPAIPAQAGSIDWDQLNLTPQQSSQIQRLESDWARERSMVLDQIERDKAELKSLLMQPNSDRERIQLLQRRISHNKMYLEQQSLETFLDKRDVLLPEQRAKLRQILPEVIPAAAPANRSR